MAWNGLTMGKKIADLALAYADDVPWRDEILTRPIKAENGYFTVPDAPGFGADRIGVNQI